MCKRDALSNEQSIQSQMTLSWLGFVSQNTNSMTFNDQLN